MHALALQWALIPLSKVRPLWKTLKIFDTYSAFTNKILYIKTIVSTEFYAKKKKLERHDSDFIWF